MRLFCFLTVIACFCGEAISQQQVAAVVPVATSSTAQAPTVCPFAYMYKNGDLYYYYAVQCDYSNPQGMTFDNPSVPVGCKTPTECNYQMGQSSIRNENSFQFVTLIVQEKKKDAQTIVKYKKAVKQTKYLDQDADIEVPDAQKDNVKKISSQLVKIQNAEQYFRVYEVKYTAENGDEFFFITGQEIDPKKVKKKDTFAVGTFKSKDEAEGDAIVVVGLKEYHVTLKAAE